MNNNVSTKTKLIVVGVIFALLIPILYVTLFDSLVTSRTKTLTFTEARFVTTGKKKAGNLLEVVRLTATDGKSYQVEDGDVPPTLNEPHKCKVRGSDAFSWARDAEQLTECDGPTQELVPVE